jgi:hypothetical protein
MATVLYLMTAARDFVCTLRASFVRQFFVCRPYSIFESKQAGVHQFFSAHNCTPHIPGDTDSKPLPAEIHNKQNTTHYKPTALLHTNNHEQCQKNDDEP